MARPDDFREVRIRYHYTDTNSGNRVDAMATRRVEGGEGGERVYMVQDTAATMLPREAEQLATKIARNLADKRQQKERKAKRGGSPKEKRRKRRYP